MLQVVSDLCADLCQCMHSQHLVVLLNTVIKEVDIPSMFLRLMYMIENNMSAQRAMVADGMDTHLELEVQTSGAEEGIYRAHL